MQMQVFIEPKRRIGRRDTKIYGHFLEHFHRQIYGGVFDPNSILANGMGFRKDVIQALKEIKTPIIRWPGGCFVSSYHWKDGIGKSRTAVFDKSWRVEEPNSFGTDEFIDFCRETGAEPYICTNAGTGSPEDMSDWVEYCNLKSEGKWAKARIENGHEEPHGVKYWSIGNENYGQWEIGAKSADEWGRFVLESAKMMKRVDPSIELLAASITDIEWNLKLLKEAGQFLDWISIHGYWDKIWFTNKLSDYESCMAYTTEIEEPILKAESILGALGYSGKIRIAFDEWNLRGWYHPHVHQFENVPAEVCAKARDDNDFNASYTMADAVFNACFLNQCLKHCKTVGMANFAPAVNTRGAIYTFENGIVKRPTYYVFELYTKYMGDEVVDVWMPDNEYFEVSCEGKAVRVPSLDIVATVSGNGSQLRIAIVNRHPDKTISVKIDSGSYREFTTAILYGISGDSKNAYNDVHHPDRVCTTAEPVKVEVDKDINVEIKPHSVNILVMT
ncbi:MAG: alpha-N-arabinofuranosidase [Clostridia bacterium]|nr:alpha-N-arabinofuranosidase [Clostridia bacterium]